MGRVLGSILHLPPSAVLALVSPLPALEASAFMGVLLPGEIGMISWRRAGQPAQASAGRRAGGRDRRGGGPGDLVGYWLGQPYGETIFAKVPNRIVRPVHMQRAEETVPSYGGREVVFGRYTAALRAWSSAWSA